MKTMTLEQAYTPNQTMPLMAAVALHAMLFILNPTILKRGVNPFNGFPTMVIHTADHLPVLAPPLPKPVPKPVPKHEKKKKGLARQHPKPIAAKPKPAPKPIVHKPFVSHIDMPKFLPRDNEDVLAATSKPTVAPAAKERMVQSAVVAPPLLRGRSHGIVAQDVHMQLVDKSSLAGTSYKSVIVPIADERGDVAQLPSATLHNAPKGSHSGYRFKPGEGAAELAGRDKTGYHSVIVSETNDEGTLSTSGGAVKTIKGNGFEISGSVGNRKVLSRQVPEYPRWAEERGITATVQVYFTVRPDGTIRSNLRIQRSSGYAELDQLAKDALLKWRFSPSDPGDDSVSWGVITFRFTLS